MLILTANRPRKSPVSKRPNLFANFVPERQIGRRESISAETGKATVCDRTRTPPAVDAGAGGDDDENGGQYPTHPGTAADFRAEKLTAPGSFECAWQQRGT